MHPSCRICFELTQNIRQGAVWSKLRANRAVAIAAGHGPEAWELADYYLAHSARADLYRRLGRTSDARSAYEKALAATQQGPERQFLQQRIRQLG